MGYQFPHNDRTKMKAFVISALVGLAFAAPTPDVSSHVVNHGHGAVVAHGVHQAHHGAPVAHGLVPVAHPVAHAVHHPVVAHPVAHHAVAAHPVAVAHPAVVAHPVAHHAIAHPVAHHPVVAHPVAHHPVVAHPAPAYAPAPAPAYKPAPAPAYKPAPYVEPEGKDEPYTYQYGVADDYSKANSTLPRLPMVLESSPDPTPLLFPMGVPNTLSTPLITTMDTLLRLPTRELLLTLKPSPTSQPLPTMPKPLVCFVNIYQKYLLENKPN